MSRISEIKFTVELNEKNIPKKIEWEAMDGGFEGKKECKSIMISLWDKEEEVTLGIDLWTKEMLIDDMNVHFYQILKKMSDTYLKSTSNNEVAKMIEDFSTQFADKLDLIKGVRKSST